MLRLICGDFGVGKTTKLYKSIQERTEKRERSFLLVPEQMTVQVEEAALSLLPESAPLFFEVSNFSRLANTVFRKHGGLSYRYASAGTRALVMWRTLLDLAPYLTAAADRPDLGEVRRMLSAISELRAASVTAEDLQSAVRRTENGKPCEILLMISSIRTPTPKVADATTPTRLMRELTNSMEIFMTPDWIAMGVPRVAIIPTYFFRIMKLCGLKSKPNATRRRNR